MSAEARELGKLRNELTSIVRRLAPHIRNVEELERVVKTNSFHATEVMLPEHLLMMTYEYQLQLVSLNPAIKFIPYEKPKELVFPDPRDTEQQRGKGVKQDDEAHSPQA